VAAAGLDWRIGCVAAIVATPDWKRPGMRVDSALRFQRSLADVYGKMQARVRVNLHPGVGHAMVPAMLDNCVTWFEEHG